MATKLYFGIRSHVTRNSDLTKLNPRARYNITMTALLMPAEMLLGCEAEEAVQLSAFRIGH